MSGFSMSEKDKLNHLKERARTYEKEIVRQQVKIAELEAQLQYLHDALVKQEGIKEQIKILYANLDRAIIQALDKKGYTRKRRSRQVSFPTLDPAAHTRDELMVAAWIHDVKRYFQYQGLSENMKFRYRVASKIYRLTRDVSKNSAKRAYRVTRRRKLA
jgi:hypothetical protein